MAEREVGVGRDLDADDPLPVRRHELRSLQRRGDGAEAVDEPGVLEHTLDLVVHHDGARQVVHLRLAFEYPDPEPAAGEQDRGHHADGAAADDHDIGIGTDVDGHAGPPRNRVTSASACASMNDALWVSWPSSLASGALT